MSSWIQHVNRTNRKTGRISWKWKVSRNRKNDINRKTTKAVRCDGGISLGMTCPPMCSLPVSAIRSAPPHSSSAWGVEKCADIKTRGFATVQTQWHNRSGRWCEGGEAPRAPAVRPQYFLYPPFSRHVRLPHGKSCDPGPGHPHPEGGHHQRGRHADRCGQDWWFGNRLRILKITMMPNWHFCVAMCTFQTPDKCAVSLYSSLLQSNLCWNTFATEHDWQKHGFKLTNN